VHAPGEERKRASPELLVERVELYSRSLGLASAQVDLREEQARAAAVLSEAVLGCASSQLGRCSKGAVQISAREGQARASSVHAQADEPVAEHEAVEDLRHLAQTRVGLIQAAAADLCDRQPQERVTSTVGHACVAKIKRTPAPRHCVIERAELSSQPRPERKETREHEGRFVALGQPDCLIERVECFSGTPSIGERVRAPEEAGPDAKGVTYPSRGGERVIDPRSGLYVPTAHRFEAATIQDQR
jgi:hypothetical protein